MANAITIDNYNVQVHERYANDQKVLDLKVIADASEIPAHMLIPGSKSTFSSQWDALFDFNVGINPWAFFSPPPEYLSMRNRFFSFSISDKFDWADENEEEKEEKQKREEQQRVKAYKKLIQSRQSRSGPLALFERDQKRLLELFDSIELLNGWLRHVHARKLQYQKG